MSESGKKKSGFQFGRFCKRTYRFLRVCPWTFLLIASAVFVEYLPDRMQGETLNYTMIVFALVVFVIEIIKGADIRLGRFVLDLFVAIVGVVAASALITYEITQTGQSPLFYQWIVAAVVILDAMISTTIAFSTALRNMAVAHDM
jgi:hypothetical protein